MAAIALFGVVAYRSLPVSDLPTVDYPTIFVNAGLPGADPGMMASGVASVLERQFTTIAGVEEMTSSSTPGNSNITMSFDLDRKIDSAVVDVQTAISAAIRENKRFYTQTLGMRLVKRSVNQDDVSAYHLFYADAVGHPGTDLTFFDWPVPRERRGTVRIHSLSLPWLHSRWEERPTHTRPAASRGAPRMNLPTEPDRWTVEIANAQREEALAAFGFTERQSRFLAHCLAHSGAFVERPR